MNSVNVTVLEGRLTADPVVKTMEKGTLLCTFSLAYNRYYRKDGDTEAEKEVSFFDVETWGRTAELCRDLAVKGTLVRVTGRLRQNRWDDGEGGHHAKVIIVADRVEFAKGNQGREEPEEPEGESV
jgi:single-strand DNA-binding protein